MLQEITFTTSKCFVKTNGTNFVENKCKLSIFYCQIRGNETDTAINRSL